MGNHFSSREQEPGLKRRGRKDEEDVECAWKSWKAKVQNAAATRDGHMAKLNS